MLLLVLSGRSAASAGAGVRRVLVLDSFGNNFAPFSTESANFRTELARQSPEPIEFYEALLESARFDQPEVERHYVEYLRALFSERRYDLIVAIGGPALQFWTRHRDTLAPNAPVLVAGMEQRMLGGRPLTQNETYVGCKQDTGGLIADILRLLPETQLIQVIVGDSPIERFWLNQIRSEFKAFEGRVRFEWPDDRPAAEMRKRAASLPPNSVILYGMLMMDHAGIPNEQDRLLDILQTEANAPIFGYFENQLGRGIVGGHLVPVRRMAAAMAAASVRIFSGETPGDISTPPLEPKTPIYDWRELERWKIPESRLPPGSEIRYRPPSPWNLYRKQILAGIVVLLAQAAAIAGLLMHRARARRMQIDLAEGAERMGLAADAAKLDIWVWSIAKDEVWMTGKGRSLFGFPESERIGMDRLTAALHAEDQAAFRRAVSKSLAGAPAGDEEFRLDRADGRTEWIGLRLRAELGRDGKPVLIRGVYMDVTERRAAELELAQLRGHISHVGRVSVMGQLASALAHELNQPLGAILSNTDAATLFLQNDPPDLDEVRAILDDIRKDDQRAGEVIMRMRRLLKRRELEFGPVDVAELIEQAVTLLRPDAMTRRVFLEVALEADLPPVRGDWVHLQQVLLNLMLNGMDAMEPNAPADRRLTIAARRAPEGGVEISARDTGPGIPEEKIRQVFDEFYSTKPDGMGMGLPISKTIIEAHGGRLWAENHPLRGAEFLIRLQAL